MRVVFVHLKNSNRQLDQFPAVVRQAVFSGYDVTIIGNESAAQPGADWIDIRSLSQSTERFHEVYKHISSNGLEYERFCFDRWFLFAAARKDLGRDSVLLDSDVLIYPGAEESLRACTRNGELISNAPYSWYGTDDALDYICEYFIKAFETEETALAAATPFRNVSDMNVLLSVAKREAGRFADIVRTGANFGIDSNIYTSYGSVGKFDSLAGFRKFYGFESERPLFKRVDGELIGFSTVHFQGRSKFFLDHFLTCSRDGLVDLSAWFSTDSNSSHPMYLKVLEYWTWLKENFPIA